MNDKKKNPRNTKSEKGKLWQKFSKKHTIIASTISAMFCILLLVCGITTNKISKLNAMDPELRRAITYEQFEEGSDNVEGTEDDIKFSAFFLRDINGDGYAEKIKGTCKDISQQDTLYMELNVQGEAYLEDAIIEINGTNFSFLGNIAKDEQLKDNYFGNTNRIEFNTIRNGSQRLLEGQIKSSLININDFSKNDNKIILTGKYVNTDGIKKDIRKEIDLTVDWYIKNLGAKINNTRQDRDIKSVINEKNNTINLKFAIETSEDELAKSIDRRCCNRFYNKHNIKATIPQLNGYDPINVYAYGGNYNNEARELQINEMSDIDCSSNYTVTVEYPLEAYESIEGDTIEIYIPVETYYECANNPNGEFDNPLRSYNAYSTITTRYRNFPEDGTWARFDAKIESENNIISKRNIMNAYSGTSAVIKNDTYKVIYRMVTGADGASKGATMKETEEDKFVKTDSSFVSMENISTITGIKIYKYGFLNNDGWIKIYDDETGNLVKTIDALASGNTYTFDTPIKHIRIETSENKKNSHMEVVLYKEIDNEYISKKYTKEEVEDFKYIRTSGSGYLGGRHVNTDTNTIQYQEEYSTADVKMSVNNFNTQITEKDNQITINASSYSEHDNTLGWIDGSFLLKMPQQILAVQINDVQINNDAVSILNYEVVQKDGCNFIKINTKNNSETQQGYTITFNVDITPNPTSSTSNGKIELYAYNKVKGTYANVAKDIYDVNDNLDTQESVQYDSYDIAFSTPSTLLTNQIITNYDNSGSSVISPEIADIRQSYAKVDNEEKRAKIGVVIKNNYKSTVSDIKILGKIPYEGNTYVLSNEDLGSTYTVKMMNSGIEVPTELQDKVTVYYSENENATKELTNVDNGWKTIDQVTNWDNIKTYIIDFGQNKINSNKEYVFYYTVQIPNGLAFNEVSYSHHAVWCNLDTPEGKYPTQVEPSKIGLRIAEKYDLELTKYRTNKDVLVSGATYSVKEVINGEVSPIGKTAVTKNQGQLTIKGLYVEKTYEIEEIKSPSIYTLNTDKIRFTTKVDENGVLTVEKLEGTTKEDFAVTKNEGEDYKVSVKVEDEVRTKLEILKLEKDTDIPAKYVYYKVTGKNLPSEGQVIRIDQNGKAEIELDINEEYTLQETKATGYYLADPIKFKIVNNDGNYNLEILEGNVKENSIVEENDIPVAKMTLENEKMPTYDLEITKIRKITNVNATTEENVEEGNKENTEVLQGAKFRLYKDNKQIGMYTTDANGKILINGLYQYVEGKDEDAIYTLREVTAPEGYSVVKDIKFKVCKIDGKLEFISVDGIKRNYQGDGNTLKLQIEDSPVFKLIKRDGETSEAIANAKFAIYNIENGNEPAKNGKGETLGTKEIIDGKEVFTVTTDQNGELMADLPEGQYKAIEVQAPDKYQISDQEYYFTIGALKSKIGFKKEWEDTISNKTINYGYEYGYEQQIIETKDKGYLVECGGKVIKYNVNYEKEWEQIIGDENDIVMAELEDGNYICLNKGIGNSWGYNTIKKLDSKGNIKWEKILKDNLSVWAITETKDGGFLVGGTISGNIDDNMKKTVVIKYNTEAEEQWVKEITSTVDQIITLKETKDGGFLVAVLRRGGTILDFGNGYTLEETERGIAKYNSNNNIQWAKPVGKKFADVITSLIETTDGSIVVGGFYESSYIDLGNGVHLEKDNGQRRSMIIKYNSNGEAQWAKSTKGSFDQILTITETSDGGYLAGGFVNRQQILENNISIGDGYGQYVGIFIKYNTNGNIEYAKNANTTIQDYNESKSVSEIVSLKETSNGYYLMIVFNENMELLKISTTEKTDALIKETDKTDEQNYMVSKLLKTKDGGYVSVLTQRSDSYGNHINAILLIKYNSNGNIQWKRKMVKASYFDEAIETSDGGIIVKVMVCSAELELENEEKFKLNNNYGVVLLKYTSTGEIEWAKDLGKDTPSENASYKNAIKETKDNGILVVGAFEGIYDLGNGSKLTTNDSIDGMIIKYNLKGEVQFAKQIGGTGIDKIYTCDEAQDGGYIVGGYSEKGIALENGTHIGGGILIKYNAKGKVEWGTSTSSSKVIEVMNTKDGGYLVRGIKDDKYTIMKYDAFGNLQWNNDMYDCRDEDCVTMIETKDGGYVIGGNIRAGSHASIVKYDKNGEQQWINNLGEQSNIYIKDLIETMDEGIIVTGGYMNSKSEVLGNGVYIENTYNNTENYSFDGLIIKYDKNGVAQWAKNTGKIKNEYINSVIELNYGNYIVGGIRNANYSGNSSQHNSIGGDSMILQVQEQSSGTGELLITNNRKQFKITTDVKEFEGVKGGTISGEDEEEYEIVKYGDSNTKEIKIVPNENYEILQIKVNEDDYPFEKASDGSYTMPVFANVTEDKNIVVTFGLADNKLTINKVDNITKTPLQGAEFTIEQVEERENPENVIGSITSNSSELQDIYNPFIAQANRFYFPEQDGKYISNNNLAYQSENDMKGAPEEIIESNIANSTANSVTVINLSKKTGRYLLEINAEISSQEGKDIGYATIKDATKQSSATPTYDKEEGRFIYISGEVEATNYYYELEGGKVYNLFFGYRKDESENVGQDRFTINSLKVYSPSYSFIENNGKYELNTQKGDINSYIPIDLTNNTGKYNIIVNAEIQSATGNYGYITVTNGTTAPSDDIQEGKVLDITGNQEAKDYSIELQGGQMYYLHLGYVQTGFQTVENDKFVINSVKVELSNSERYKVEEVTNSEGKIITQIPFGKYKITETQVPEGYLPNEEPIEFEFTANGDHEITIENENASRVLVHHYVKKTDTQVAEDEKLEGKQGTRYATAPKLDLQKYELERDEDGKYILPTNLSGTYADEAIEVVYEYVEKDIPLTVHHYIEGTSIRVPLAEGTTAEDVILKGKEGETYETTPIDPNLLDAKYELVETPEDSTGTYSGTEMEVTYYYKTVERNVTLTKYQEDGITPLANAKFTIEPKAIDTPLEQTEVIPEVTPETTVYTTNAEGKIETILETGEYTITEVEAPEGYVLPEDPTTNLTINRDVEDQQINIINKKEKGTVTVHYYLEGTEDKVPLIGGGVAEDIIKTGNIGEIYATKEPDNVSQKYELIEEPENSSGLITKEDIIVTYYYRSKTSQITDKNFEKTSTTEKVKRLNEKIPYTLQYTANVSKYKGKVIVTMVDKLPYEIDEEKSNIAGGIYDKENKTITWTETIENVDTYTNGTKEINVSKTIEIVYKNIDTTVEKISNEAEAKINLEEADLEEPTETITEIPVDAVKEVTVTKTWVDTDAQKDKRPDSILILVKNGEEVVDTKELQITKEQDEYTINFTNLPKYNEEGNEIEYVADETVLEGKEHEKDLKFYSKEVSGTTITNTFSVPDDEITVTVNKVWVDKDNIYEKRPETLILQLKNKTTGEVVQSGEITVQTQDYYIFTKVKKYDENGNEIEYTADEKEVYEDDLYNYEKQVGEIEEIANVEDEKEITITNTMSKTPAMVVVKYIDKNTKQEISDWVEKEGIIGEEFDVEEDKKEIPGYTLIEEPTEKTGTYTEKDQEKVYYYAKNSNVIVKYLERGTNSVLADEIEIQGHEGKVYTATQKAIEGYVCVENTENTAGAMGREDIEVIYYYEKEAKVITKYLEKETNKVLTIDEQYEQTGYIGKEYETEKKEIAGYTYVEDTGNTEGTMTEEDIEVIYYYAKTSKVTVKYLEKTTNKELADEEEIEGYKGKEYTTEKKEITGYTCVENTENIEGTMTEENIEVIYYYSKAAKVIVQHIDKNSETILKTETIVGMAGDQFETHAEDIENYVLVRSPQNPNGIITEGEQTIKYYYAHISSGIIEKHIDINTGELLKSKEHSGNEGDEYKIEAQTFEGYDLVEEKLPTNAEGKMEQELIEIKYYYHRQASVKVQYLYKETEEKIEEDIIIKGHENESYQTEAKKIKGYTLLNEPENKQGKMRVTQNEDGTFNTETLVKYYYTREAGGVIIKYIDINTGKVIEEQKIPGKIGDEYDIPLKQINNYILIEKDSQGNSKLPTNAKGTMVEDPIEIIYYYARKTKVIVQYINKQTNQVIDTEEIEGAEGNSYKSKAKEFDGYQLMETPKNAEGEMKAESITVKYYYNQKAEVEIQYLEEETENTLKESAKIEGYVGDKYKTEKEDIPYYNYVRNTENTKGTMTAEKVTVKYYYKKQLFNLKIDTWVNKATVNGVSQGERTIANKDSIYKLDIHKKKIANATVKVTYKIRISNVADIAGKAEVITDIMPNGFTFSQEDNKVKWSNEGGVLTTTDLKGETIKAGEYKEIELILRWKNGDKNFGTKNNIAVISKEYNEAGYVDVNKEDNRSKAKMLITIATGLDQSDKKSMARGTLIGLTGILGVIMYKRRRYI